jgi:hypothetical protein
MINHAPWVGQNYRSEGVAGEKLLIVGHSHHGDEDHDDYTKVTVERDAFSGQLEFFNAIAGYFGDEENRVF